MSSTLILRTKQLVLEPDSPEERKLTKLSSKNITVKTQFGII